MLGAPAKAKDGCDWKTRTCFGINWKTAAPADVAGINVNSRNEGGDTPLHWAVENGSLAVVAVLLQVGADTNARSDATSYTPLFWAAGWNANLIIAALLIEAEADVNTEESRDDSLTGSDGFPTYGYETTPLHIVE